MWSSLVRFFSFNSEHAHVPQVDPNTVFQPPVPEDEDLDFQAEDEEGLESIFQYTEGAHRSLGAESDQYPNLPESERDPRRRFTTSTKKLCWNNAESIPGRDPARWKRDIIGNVIFKKFTNCYGPICYQYDHWFPHAKGGKSDSDNCQVLMSMANNWKSDKWPINTQDIADGQRNFWENTTLSDHDMDVIEYTIFGNIRDQNSKDVSYPRSD